jgi:hypothetical protein
MKNFIQYLQESRFQPHPTVEPTKGADLVELIKKNAEAAFGQQNVETWNRSQGGGVNITIGDFLGGERHFEMQVKNKTDTPYSNDEMAQLPEICISFNWGTNGPAPENNSEKEYKLYTVRKTLEKDSMDAAHKIRDYIIRPLSKYAVILYFIPASSRGLDDERRSRWYKNVLMSSGFKEIDGSNPSGCYWVPTNWWTTNIKFSNQDEHQ